MTEPKQFPFETWDKPHGVPPLIKLMAYKWVTIWTVTYLLRKAIEKKTHRSINSNSCRSNYTPYSETPLLRRNKCFTTSS